MRTRIVVVLVSVLLAAPAFAAERDDALARIEGLARSESGLEVWVNSGADRGVAEGEAIELHLRAERDLDVTVLYIDSTGQTTVVSEVVAPGQWRLAAGEHRIVAMGSASSPYGRDTVLAIATTDGPLGIDKQGGAAADVAEHVRSLVGGRQDIDIARSDVTIVRKRTGASPRYDPVEVAANLDRQLTRGIPQPKIDLDIKFALDSARLTDQARLDLEANAQAIMSARLHGFRFRLEGHTDDQGDADYNQSLSEQRAEAARGYMLECCRVEGDRLESLGRGETEPLVPDSSPEARQENRRVVLRMLR